MQVYILLFNAGTDNEGIHSLSANGRNTVLMFESEDDAVRFALMLEAQDFPEASVEAISDEEVEEFCQGAGFDCALVPTGTLVTPPEATVDSFDWDPDGDAPPPEAPGDFSARELEEIRRRLENLL